MASKHPNILILYSDQHSARALGCYGNTQVKTPNLDRLAREGVRFEHAYTQNPICTPSRMCMLSGQYAHNTGYYGLMGEKPQNLPNLFDHFGKNGYRTGAIGKLHTPAGWVSDSCDYVADGYGYEWPVKRWNQHLQQGAQGLKTNEYSAYLADHDLHHDRDDKVLHEWYEDYGYTRGQGLDARPSRLPKEHTIEAWSADRAIEFMKEAHEEEKPFALWVTVPHPHQAYAASKDFWDLYEGMDIQLADNAEDPMEGRAEAEKKMHSWFKEGTDWMLFEPKDYTSARKRVLRGYYACVSQVDDAMGKIVRYLDESGTREDTIIVYLTDHGEFAGEHGMIEKAPGIGFRCVTRIPMIFSWKNHLPENRVCDQMAESIDVFPTMCALAGVPMPDWVDGMDITGLLTKNEAVRDYAVTENPITRTIHGKRYKLTQYLPEVEGRDFGELYDTVEDPGELHNLYFDEQYQDVVHKLQYELYCWLSRTMRAKTVYPSIPFCCKENKGYNGLTWDRAAEMDVYDEDGLVGKPFYDNLIEHKWKNYL